MSTCLNLFSSQWAAELQERTKAAKERAAEQARKAIISQTDLSRHNLCSKYDCCILKICIRELASKLTPADTEEINLCFFYPFGANITVPK
jgi:hypothetical protein